MAMLTAEILEPLPTPAAYTAASSLPGPVGDLVAMFSAKKEEDTKRRLMKFTFASASFVDPGARATEFDGAITVCVLPH